MEDCFGLKYIAEALTKISSNDQKNLTAEINHVDEIKIESKYKFGKNKYVCI
jgi:hypothetical protein